MNQAATLSTPPSDALGILQQRIVLRTCDRVRQLRVERVDGRIVVHGSTPSYYVKQLVLEAIREAGTVEPSEPVRLNIRVRGDLATAG
jgi:hypothetical protein